MVAAMTQPWSGSGEVLTPVVTVGAFADLQRTRALGIDRVGNLWCAADAGLVRFDGSALARFGFAEPFAVTGIAPGPEGVVYLATHEGLLRFASGEFTRFRAAGDRPLTAIATNPGGDAYMLALERLTQARHVLAFDGHAVREVLPGVEFPPGLEITSLGFDAAGQLVIGAIGALALHDGDTWKVFRGLDRSSTFAPAIDAVASGPGVLWLGTPAGVYEYRDRTFALHRTERPVACLCADGDEVWIGMRAGGLGRLRAGELSVLQPGGTLLPHEDVTALVRGTDGRTWLLAGGEVAFIRDGEIERLPP